MLSKTTSSVPGSISPKGSSKKKSVYIYGKICNSYINFRIILHRMHQNGSNLPMSKLRLWLDPALLPAVPPAELLTGDDGAVISSSTFAVASILFKLLE